MAMEKRTSTLPIDDLQFASDRLATELKVFVAGPEIQRTWNGHEWRRRSKSTLLRLRVHNLVESSGHESVLGEHRLIATMAATAMSHAPSVVVSETYVAATSCNAIIIIPDSPGSFCELGLWTQDEALCSKMLILANEQFESFVSYINPGVFGVAADNHAEIRWVDYGNWRSCRGIVEEFLDRRQQKVFRRDLFRGRHSQR